MGSSYLGIVVPPGVCVRILERPPFRAHPDKYSHASDHAEHSSCQERRARLPRVYLTLSRLDAAVAVPPTGQAPPNVCQPITVRAEAMQTQSLLGRYEHREEREDNPAEPKGPN
jgi:hypothetical protein